MSPVIASLLTVPDHAMFVTTFVTLYSGLVPMLSTAGNTTDDGFIGAIVNDCFASNDEGDARDVGPLAVNVAVTAFARPVRIAGAVLSIAGAWMVIAPQARLGLPALRWMSAFAFPGEALAGAIVLLVGLSWSLGGRAERRVMTRAI